VNKVILILSDALHYDAAVAGMGFLGHLVEAHFASTISRLLGIPIQETMKAIPVVGENPPEARLH
jgi:hypothetical protein